MAKSETTLEIEKALWNKVDGRREIACHEVTIGMYGTEIVDFITVKISKDMQITCYEVKVSKSDFYSKAKWTFVGERNYFAMPFELYEEVKKDIPPHVGVLAFDTLTKSLYRVKTCRIQKTPKNREMILLSIARSLNREFYKAYGKRPYTTARLGENIYEK